MIKKKIYCFIGLPASGKGTQAEIFAKKKGFNRIGIGDIVREAMETNEDLELRKRFTERYNKGLLQPDEEVFPLIKYRLDNIKENGVVFDNFPFNLGQSDFLLDYIKENAWDKPIIIYINVNPESAIKRISSRRVCPKCKAVYTGRETCQKCGTKLISRSDDNEKTARTRIQNYMPNIEEVVSRFKKNGTIYEIDGEPSVEKVKEEIESKVA